MMNQHENKTFIELGPWVRGLSYLEHDDLDEGKQFIAPNHSHLHKRTFLRLPKLPLPQPHPNNFKTVLKVSHQSLDLTAAPKEPVSRYGALNGSLRKGKQPLTGRSVQLAREESRTIDVGSLQRKMSTVQMGEAEVGQRVLRGRQRRLVNEQCAKKRGLMQFIREVALNKDFMQFYLDHKGERAFSPRP